MNELFVDGGQVRFEPEAGWTWHGWDGTLAVTVAARELQADGRPVARPEDLQRVAQKLLSKSYTATGFSDVPGIVTAAQVECSAATLSPVVSHEGTKAVTKATRGTFTVTCTPALKAATPPVPDPVVMKRGRWSVVEPGQSLFRSE
jgi:hypothetical protein